MDKQHFDHIENRIRQAAENVSPPFKEEAWNNMETLLDNELKKKRRKIILWLPLLLLGLLTGAGIVYYIYDQAKDRPTQVKDKFAKSQLHQPDIQAAPGKKSTASNSEHPKKDQVPNASQTLSETAPDKISTYKQEQLVGKQPESVNNQEAREAEDPGKPAIRSNKRNSRERLTSNESEPELNGSKRPVSAPSGSKGEKKDKQVKPEQVQPRQNQPEQNQPNRYLPDEKVPAIEKRSGISPETAEDNAAKTDSANSISVAESKEQEKTLSKSKVKLDKPRPRLYFMASLAADATNTDKWLADNRQTVFGAGIGYRFGQRFGLQTGFYAGRKLYTAGPGDYKTQPGSYWSTVDMMSIDANCYIYEIPLSLRYDLIQRNKYNLYAVGGVSSILMKSEWYGYHYKKNGVYHWAERTYSGNKHFLSMADVSLGFEYKILPAFYFQAEPYIKLPVGGLGEGKIKLHSTGIQAGIKYQPLRRK